ncbi:UDP-N-acetylmuramoylalanyl-D-glutamate--2,6-diaminopimelate ligase [Hasllibacter halocynthiae]|uniref:UDP-N-acetylmuramoyl-L-alanyl-D-glutamate--2,6-diaminopimelate ligase n=1 Tax=Hasllibacter halocynthiae TaxID=595589 RepID=A0A2T0X796_9RHOB|nr:UDP-N-acetylmuramoyl-L-alanyl-D-glutamate--2,6-diaminopimelate ligase [Hasllibacter halocynthiae]PRY94822.1 UDP-N-acetylmuramoylalanyl-D-glutamate--2,6-diaminopimelate ligase [Hasllibacter halocynthiae]
MKTRTLSSLGLTAPSDVAVTGLSVDSRKVGPGELFAALPGSAAHGARFAAMAAERGAAAILTDREGAGMLLEGVPVVVAEDPREALARAAALWFGAQPEVIAAVTGTNGKSSVTAFVRQIWEGRGIAGINLGTTGVEGAWTAPTAHTTPEPITLHRLLSEAAAAGVTHCALEASSHGLDQRRLDGLRLRAAGFTNFSRDHLDYHGTFEAYFAAKMHLFERVLPEDGIACVNIDDPKGLEVAAIARERGQDVLTLGATEGADVRLLATRFEEDGQSVRFDWRGGVHQVRLGLVGDFQAANALMAAALAHACGMEAGEAIEALPRLGTVRGRMQLAAVRARGGAIFVDYAHTPDAVATALRALRPHAMGRLIAVVGAGGDRDRAKRPLMGRAAAEHADAVIVTDDNPRSEDPAAIRAAVLEGAPGALEVGDRAEAILRGTAMLGPGDVLLVAGKGHEAGQEVAGTVHPFDDVEQASIAVAALEEAARG